MSPSTSTRKLAAIMFTDMVGYTALMQQDEERASILRSRHRRVLDDTVESHGGTTLQYFGDGTLSIFDSAIEAVRAAVGIQVALQQEPVVPLRIGLSLGDIVYDDEGIYGDGVNLASRIESVSATGSVLVSDKVFAELQNHRDIICQHVGRFRFKNVQNAVDVYAIANNGLHVPAETEMSGKQSAPPDSSIAILPLTNLSTDPENECFCDGITEEVINTLASAEGIAVISRTSSFRFRNSPENPQSIGRVLGVSAILEGSVRRTGNSVRISVRLVNTTDGYQMWSEVYDRTLENILDLQTDIAQSVLRRVRATFGIAGKKQSVANTPGTESGEAYNLYLKGRYYWNKWTPDNALKAIDAFKAAISLDPNYSASYCSLSNCYSYLGSCGQMKPIQAFSNAQECILTAIEKDGNNAESHHALAMLKFLYRWDWTGAEASFKRALDLKLDSSAFHQSYAQFLSAVGRPSESIEHMERASRLDPLSLGVMTHLGMLRLFTRDYSGALQKFDEVLDMDPSFRFALECKGVALYGLGETEACIGPLLEYQRLTGDPLKGLSVLGLVMGLTGKRQEAEEYLAKLRLRQSQNPDELLHIDFAIIHTGLEQYETAVDYLHQACNDKLGLACLGMVFIFRCPLFDGLHRFPAFREIEAITGLEVTNPSTMAESVS